MIDDQQQPVKPKHFDRFCQLCYELFQDNPAGQEFMNICKEYLNEPVALWDKPNSYAYMREGENNFIRRMFKGIELYKLIRQQPGDK